MKAIKGLLFELAVWLLSAGAFLYAFVRIFGQPTEAVVPHLSLVAMWAAGLASARGLLEGVGPRPRRAGRFLMLVVGGSALLLLWLYYATVLIGLNNWGRVPTLSMLVPYLTQWRALLDTLGVPVWPVILGLGFLGALAFVLWSTVLRRATWPEHMGHRTSTFARLAAASGGLSLIVLAGVDLAYARYGASAEPLTQTLHPAVAGRKVARSDDAGRRRMDEEAAQRSAAYAAGSQRPTTHVFLVVSDALRADRMSLLGYKRETTPHLDRRAREGRLVFARTARAACSESFCGLVAMSRSRPVHRVSRNDLTLAGVLKRHGYRTGLILGGDHTNFYGLADWLGPVDEYWDGTHAKGYVNDDMLVLERAGLLRPSAGGQPLFVQFHLMSSHALGRRHDAYMRYSPVINYYRMTAVDAGDAGQAERVGNFYDNGVLQFDAMLEQLLSRLKAQGLLDDALVIVTADHGEMLGEHGLYSHAQSVFEPVLNIPFVVMRFGPRGVSTIDVPEGLVSQLDVAPTVTAMLGLTPPASWVGFPVQSAPRRDRLEFAMGDDIGLIDVGAAGGPWKFWVNRRSGDEHAYALAQDPAEASNRVAAVPKELRSKWMDVLRPAIDAPALR